MSSSTHCTLFIRSVFPVKNSYAAQAHFERAGHGRPNTCVGCLPGVRLPPVLAARQKSPSPPETSAKGKFLTVMRYVRFSYLLTNYNQVSSLLIYHHVLVWWRPWRVFSTAWKCDWPACSFEQFNVLDLLHSNDSYSLCCKERSNMLFRLGRHTQGRTLNIWRKYKDELQN